MAFNKSAPASVSPVPYPNLDENSDSTSNDAAPSAMMLQTNAAWTQSTQPADHYHDFSPGSAPPSTPAITSAACCKHNSLPHAGLSCRHFGAWNVLIHTLTSSDPLSFLHSILQWFLL